MSTSDAAARFLSQHQQPASDAAACWQTLQGLFQTQRPDAAQLARVSLVANVAIDAVFSARQLDEQACQAAYTQALDYAECSGLYNYVMGYHDAAMALRREREQLASDD